MESHLMDSRCYRVKVGKGNKYNYPGEWRSSESLFSTPGAFILFFVFCVLFFNGCKARQEGEKEPVSPTEVIIRVNNKEITYAEFQDGFKRQFLGEGTTADVTEDEMKDLKRAFVNQFVEEELLLKEAKRLLWDVSDSELAKELEEIKKEHDEEEFNSMILNAYGDMEKWKKDIKRKMVIKKVVDDVIISKVVVKEDEVKKYYREHKDEYDVKEQIRARMIVVKAEDEANQVRKRLIKGENFAKVAKEVSLSPEGRKGGDLGFFGRGDMPTEFEDVVFALPIGKVSDVIKTVYGYHIFRVEEKRGARFKEFKEARNEIMERLKREKSDLAFQMWMRSLKENASIEIREELL